MLPGKAYLQDNKWIVVLNKQPNSEWLSTVNNGKTDGVPVQVEFVDPRRARPKQRSLFFALLGDINKWSGESTEWLKEYFYTRYTVQTAGREISLADGTDNTVGDATKLIDDVIRFIFEFNVPINEAYPLLPKDENMFQYECIKHRQCLICGKNADVHHVEGIAGNPVGMGGNRTKVNHAQRYLAALCRIHHNEIHRLGTPRFCQLHHLTNIGIKVDAQTLKRIGVQGNYGQNP